MAEKDWDFELSLLECSTFSQAREQRTCMHERHPSPFLPNKSRVPDITYAKPMTRYTRGGGR